MKNLIFSLIFLFASVFNVNFVSAQLPSSINPTNLPTNSAKIKTSTNVNVLDQLVSPSVFQGEEKKEPLSRILNQLFYIGLLIAVIASIIVIIMGGVQYMTIDAISSKEGGKNKVKAALGGLLLAFSAILIFNSINPNITSLRIVFPDIEKFSEIIIGGIKSGQRVILDANGKPIYVPSTPSGESEINPILTAYSPQRGGSSMEGGYASARAGLDGQSLVRTLDDYASGNSSYVTLAADSSLYGNSYIIPQITYTNSNGETVTLKDVKGYVHDTGSAFTGKGSSRIDIPVGRDYSDGSLNSQPFSKQNIQFIPAK